MRYLVTGGAGFLGSHLVDRLIERGATVDVLDDLSAGRRRNLAQSGADSRLQLHVGCVTARDRVDALVAEADVVLHLAAVVGVPRVLEAPLRALQVNAFGSEVVLDAALRHRRPVLLASSSEVYGDGVGRERPFDEEDPIVLGPTSGVRGGYGCAKALAEWAARARAFEHDLPVLIVRLFNVVGPRQRASQGMVLPRLCAQARRGEPLTVYGDGRQTRCFAHVADVADALLALCDTPTAWGATFNVGSDREVSIQSLAEQVLAIAGSQAGIVHVPHAQAHPADARDVRRRVPSLERLEAAIGWRPERGLGQVIEAVLASDVAAGTAFG